MRAPFELSLSASSKQGRGFCRGGPHAPRLAGSFEPGLAASRRGRLRVLYESSFRALSLGLFVRGRGFCRGGPRAPRLAGSFEPGLAVSRWGRLRVLYESPFRALSLGLSAARPRFLPWGPSRPAAGGLFRARLGGLSPRTPSRPSWRALSGSHCRPLRCEADTSAARARAPCG